MKAIRTPGMLGNRRLVLRVRLRVSFSSVQAPWKKDPPIRWLVSWWHRWAAPPSGLSTRQHSGFCQIRAGCRVGRSRPEPPERIAQHLVSGRRRARALKPPPRPQSPENPVNSPRRSSAANSASDAPYLFTERELAQRVRLARLTPRFLLRTFISQKSRTAADRIQILIELLTTFQILRGKKIWFFFFLLLINHRNMKSQTRGAELMAGCTRERRQEGHPATKCANLQI